MSKKNEYLAQVMEEQAEVEAKLRKRAPAPAMARRAAFGGVAGGSGHPPELNMTADGAASSGAITPETPAVDVRITGFGWWKNIIVPPNAYVVHTRRGHKEPLHCGLGVSFRYYPVSDAYLVVPATMQTLIVNARCICQEKQGILVQGYVQWVIDDFSIAYKQLDFSDTVDPLRVVNTQLTEQAEAVIKDTVASMSLETVLADRQPIVKELTQRLRNLMEGEDGGGGLGLRIVTVQIKEAIVSSATLWETLQRPFRAERARLARTAELDQEAVISDQERRYQKSQESQQIQLESELAVLKSKADAERFDQENKEQVRREVLEAQTEAERFDREQQERVRREALDAQAEADSFDRQQQEEARRAQIEAEAIVNSLEFERQKEQTQAELDLLRLKHQLSVQQETFEAQDRQRQAEITTQGLEHRLDNELSAERIQQQLIENLPKILQHLPQPNELRTISFNGTDAVGESLTAILRLIQTLSQTKEVESEH